MTQYTCGNFTVHLLHYGNKKVFLRDNAGEEFTVQRDFFDENYKKVLVFDGGELPILPDKSVVKRAFYELLRNPEVTEKTTRRWLPFRNAT